MQAYSIQESWFGDTTPKEGGGWLVIQPVIVDLPALAAPPPQPTAAPPITTPTPPSSTTVRWWSGPVKALQTHIRDSVATKLTTQLLPMLPAAVASGGTSTFSGAMTQEFVTWLLYYSIRRCLLPCII